MAVDWRESRLAACVERNLISPKRAVDDSMREINLQYALCLFWIYALGISSTCPVAHSAAGMPDGGGGGSGGGENVPANGIAADFSASPVIHSSEIKSESLVHIDGAVNAAAPAEPGKDTAVNNPMIEDDGIFEDEQVTAAAQPLSVAVLEERARASAAMTRLAETSQILSPHHLYNQASLQPPMPMPMPPYDVSRLWRSFKFKGYGLNFVKSLTQWDQCGIGLKIPISPNYPEYDRNQALPRLTNFMGLFWEIRSGFFFRGSFSFSFPFRMVLLLLAIIGKYAQLSSPAWVENVRKMKARDSLQRLGLTLSVRMSVHGWRATIGPWLYYVPSRYRMSKILPVIFSAPALIVALLNCIMALNSDWLMGEAQRCESLGTIAVPGTSEPSWVDSRAPPNPNPNPNPNSYLHTDSTYARADINARVGSGNGNEKRRMQGLQYWHHAFLKWCDTKTTALAINIGMSKSQRSDASIGSALQFEISPFFPCVPTVFDSVQRAVHAFIFGAAPGSTPNPNPNPNPFIFGAAPGSSSGKSARDAGAKPAPGPALAPAQVAFIVPPVVLNSVTNSPLEQVQSRRERDRPLKRRSRRAAAVVKNKV